MIKTALTTAFHILPLARLFSENFFLPPFCLPLYLTLLSFISFALNKLLLTDERKLQVLLFFPINITCDGDH